MAKVLIVDDALIMRNILTTILRQAGHEIVGAASNAEEALEMFVKTKPDLVTMDILMEGEDGLSCMGNILEVDPAARVIMISAQGHGELAARAKAEGAKGYVAKPIEAESLLREAGRVLAD